MACLIYLRNKTLFFVETHRTFINLIGIPLVVITIFWVNRSNGVIFDWNEIDNWWGEWGDPIIGFSTFLVAIVIWLTNLAKNWADNLDKKITVIYQFENREVVRCEKAYLTHEGDIRNWGQTLGRQVVGKTKQNRDYYFNYRSNKLIKQVEVINEGRYFFKHFTATFFLTSIPKPEELMEENDMSKGKFLWKDGEEKAIFISDQIPPTA